MSDAAQEPLPLSVIIALTEKAGVQPSCTLEEAALLLSLAGPGRPS